MKNKLLKSVPFLILIMLVCACQQSRMVYVVVNMTGDNMQLKYKTKICANEYAGDWQPQTWSEAGFSKADGLWAALNEKEFTSEKGTEPAEISKNEGSKNVCNTETHTLNVAPHTAVKLNERDLNSAPPLVLLELSGTSGIIKYEGTPALIIQNFKSYSNDSFNFFGNSHSVLWYEEIKR